MKNVEQSPLPQPWIPYTKLQPPSTGRDMIERDRLLNRLNHSVAAHKLTLIAAPAGSGKTMVSAALAQTLNRFAWIALDESDSDLAAFAGVLVAALSEYLHEKGYAVLNFMNAVPNLPQKTTRLAGLLINTLTPAGDDHLVVILDDYHVITDPAVHQFVEELLSYCPDYLRFVIATRHDPPLPLPRLRTRGELTELRLTHLRFSVAETAEFLNRRHHLALTESEIENLHQQTEGWIAGIQLLAAVLSDLPAGPDRLNVVRRLKTGSQTVFDLLADEVLAHQPAEMQDFLLETSILVDLTPAVCLAVTQNPAAPRLLETAYRQNLFLRALTPDAHEGPYRYHDLFRAFLQQRLRRDRPQQWIELHRRAAAAAAADEEKLSHLLAAELWDEAASLLESMVNLDNERRFTRGVVIDGIETLPPAVRQNHPWLLYFVAQHYALRGQVDKATPYRTQAEEIFRETGDELGEIEMLVISAMVDMGDDAAMVNAFREKTKTAGHLMRPDHWSVYHAQELWHAIVFHDWATISEHTHASIKHALTSGDAAAQTFTSLSIGPQMAFADNGMRLLETFSDHVLASVGPDDLIQTLCAQQLRGTVRLLQGRLGEAEAAGRSAHALVDAIGGLAWVDHHVCWLIMATLLARRAYLAFEDFVAAQQPRWETQDTAVYGVPSVLYMQGFACCLQERTAEAQAVLEQLNAVVPDEDNQSEEHLRRVLLGALIAVNRGESGAAKRELRQAIALHQKVRHTIFLNDPRLALAALLGEQNRWDEALEELRLALREYNMQGTPGVILLEGERIVPLLQVAIEKGVEPKLLRPLLAILEPDSASNPIPLPDSNQHLTPRESEVLRLLASGATNPAIAAELSITERTVKAHVTRILAKLGAATRTEAAATARRLGLV